MKLTQAEWQVMNALWERYPATARDIAERLPASVKWAYTTIKTLLTRLLEKGAVSEECVRAMVSGLTDRSPGSVFVAVSGVAGPTGGTPDKPVGTVWIASGVRGEEPVAVRLNVHGDRDRVRRFATLEALLLVRKTIGAID